MMPLSVQHFAGSYGCVTLDIAADVQAQRKNGTVVLIGEEHSIGPLLPKDFAITGQIDQAAVPDAQRDLSQSFPKREVSTGN